MKIFKRIYYPIMAVAVVLMLVLGIVDSRVSVSGGNLTKSVTDSAYKYAEILLGDDDADLAQMLNTATGVDRRISSITDDEGNNIVDYLQNGGNKLPTIFVQETVVRQDSQVAGESEVVVGREVSNVIVAVPGKSEDAILLHVRTDSYPLGGATDAGTVGAMFVNVVKTVGDYDFENGERPENTVIFLFGDAGQEGDLGAAAFMNQFKGFDDVVSHIKAVGDFRANGTGGTLMVYGAADGDLGLVGKYGKFTGGAFTSSALPMLLKGTEKTEGGVFGDYNTLNFTNRGGFNHYATANDLPSTGGINKKLVSQQANAMNKFITCFGTKSLSGVDSKSSAVYFSYLDVMTVYYPVAVAFVIAGIIIGLVIAIVILNLRNKAFSWGRVASGVLLQLITLLASALSMLVVYYLVALLLSGLGVMPFHSISTIRFAGAGLFVSAAILAVVLAIVFYVLFKRTFNVGAVDVVRGNTLLFALAAVVLSFAAPAISYPFTCVAIFSLLAMLMTVIFKYKFKSKFSQDIERLFLYVWAIVFSLPLFIPLFYVAQTAFAAVSIVAIMTLVVALAGFIAPFADYLKPALDKLFVKLPQRTVRVEQTVTKQVEDKAKKGKFSEVQVKEVVKQKYNWHYKNRIGLSLVAAVSVIMILLFCSFGTTFSSAAVTAPDYYNSVYDDSLVFVYENSSATLEVRDDIAYNYIRYAVGDLTWDEEKNAYVKEYTGSVNSVIPSASATEMSIGGKEVKFNLLDASYSSVTVKLTGASSVTSVIFDKGTDDEIEYTFLSQDEITFRMPYGRDNFTMTVEGSCTVDFEQHIYGNIQNRTNPASVITNLLGVTDNDWNKVTEYFGEEVYSAFSIGVVIRQSGAIS